MVTRINWELYGNHKSKCHKINVNMHPLNTKWGKDFYDDAWLIFEFTSKVCSAHIRHGSKLVIRQLLTMQIETDKFRNT